MMIVKATRKYLGCRSVSYIGTHSVNTGSVMACLKKKNPDQARAFS